MARTYRSQKWLVIGIVCLNHWAALAMAARDESTGAAKTDARPNIVFIFSDDHATHAIGAYGGPLKDVNPTPNIDALRARNAVSKQLLHELDLRSKSCGHPDRQIQPPERVHEQREQV